MTASFEIPRPPPNEAALVIANGPSLAGVNLAALPKYASFGMNAAYRHWQQVGWYPTHYACLDEVVGLSHAEAIGGMIDRAGSGAPGQFLIRRNLVEHLGERGRAGAVLEYETIAPGSRHLSRAPVTTGSHTLVWAISQGFKTIFLLGADCAYVEIVPGAERRDGLVLEIVREAKNPNYFFDGYQQVGDRYHIPNPSGEMHLDSWRIAADAAAEAGVEVYNLSPVSRIGEFDFANVEDLIAGGPLRVTPREARAALSDAAALTEPIEVAATPS